MRQTAFIAFAAIILLSAPLEIAWPKDRCRSSQ
jgi:hypothetical protein